MLTKQTLADAISPEKGQLRLSKLCALLVRNLLLSLINSYAHHLDISPESKPALTLRRHILDILGNALDSGCKGVLTPPHIHIAF